MTAAGGGAVVATTGASADAPKLRSQFTVTNGLIRPATGTPAAPSGSEAVLLSDNSYATTTITGSGRVLIGGIGRHCGGWPVVRGFEGATALGDVALVDDRSYGTYAIGDRSLPAGNHTITIRFVNDSSTPTCDRNAYLGYARMERPADQSATPTTPPVGTTEPSPAGTPTTGGDRSTSLGLDPTGRTIPDTAYPIPSAAVFLAANGADTNAGTRSTPVRTLNRAASIAPNGGTIVVRGGTYRDWYGNVTDTDYRILEKSLTIQAFPHEQAWFDGTDVVPASRWKSDGAGHWYTTWSTPNFCNGGYYKHRYNAQPRDNSGPCGHYDMANTGFNTVNPAAADPQMAFVDGRQLTEVTTLRAVTAGSFFYDQDVAGKTGRVYLGTDPGGRTVELAKRPVALVTGAANFAIKGIGFRRYATAEYEGINSALYLTGARTLVENVTITEMAAGSLTLGAEGGVVRHSALVGNGYTAMGSNGHSTKNTRDGLVIENNLVADNNTENFGIGCTGSCGHAGIKIAHMVGFTVRNNVFDRNAGGAGFWCDNDCREGVIVGNSFTHNKVGVFYEVSSTGIIASNLVADNVQYGIQVASADTKIYNNTVVDNGAIGIWVYDDNRNAQDRRGTTIGPDTRDVVVKNNVVIGGSTTMIKVSAGDGSATNLNTGPNEFIRGLDHNSYFRAGGSGKSLVNWVDSGGRNYTSLNQLRDARRLELHGQDVATGTQPFLVDPARQDFRLRPGGVPQGEALPSDVASVMGVKASTVLVRGAPRFQRP